MNLVPIQHACNDKILTTGRYCHFRRKGMPVLNIGALAFWGSDKSRAELSRTGKEVFYVTDQGCKLLWKVIGNCHGN